MVQKKKEGQTADIINWSELYREYLHHWWWFVVSAAVLAGLTFAYIKMTYENYSVSASVLVSADQQSSSSAMALIAQSGIDFGGMFGGTASVYNEMAVMNSYAVCLKTVKEMGLNVNYYVKRGLLKKMPTAPTRTPLRLTCQASIPDTLSVGIVFKVRVNTDGTADIKTKIGKRSAVSTNDVRFPAEISTDYGKFTIDTTSYFRPGRKLSEDIVLFSYSTAAQLLSESLVVKMINKKADIIQVGMSSPNAFFIRDIVGSLIRNYNATGMEQQYERTSATYRFLNERIDSVAAHLGSTERLIAQYKREHKMPDVALSARTDATRYITLTEGLRQAEMELDVMELVKSFIDNPDNNLSLIPNVAGSAENVQTAIQSYNESLLERMAIANNARENNVTLKVLDEQLSLIRDNINVSLSRALETFRFRIAELRKQVSDAEGKMSGLPAAELEFGEIARTQAVEERLYLYLLQQREETEMNMSNIMPRGVILDQPHILIDPVGLSKVNKMILAIFMGLLLPAVYIFVKVRRRTTVVA